MENVLKMTDVNEIKDKEQRKALNSWAKTGFKGTIIAGTGFGKTRVGVIAACETVKRNDGATALILVPTIGLIDQFIEEIHKWGYEDCLENVDVMCYQSAYKLTDTKYTVIIGDEIHLGVSPEYRKVFENVKYDRLLCMTATEPEDLEYRIYVKTMAPVIYKITLDKCIELNLVSPYNVFCVPVKLTDEEDIEYKKANKAFIRYKYMLGQFDAFNEANRILKSKTATSLERQYAALFYRAIRMRKGVVDFADNKIGVLKQIVMNNKDKKILTFAGANDFTDIMCDALSPFATRYHSKISKKKREQNLEDFKDNKYNVLCSTKALNQGIDIPDANMGILCGITSKGLTMIQRVGRLLRYKTDKTSNIIILYVENSQEEKWLKNAVYSLDNIQWIKDISEISN